MDTDPGELELSADQKTELFNIGLDPLSVNEEDKSDILYDILHKPLPLDKNSGRMLPTPLRGLSSKMRSIAGAPLIELLTSSDTSISTIGTIKEYAKKAGKSAKSEDQAEAFLAVYYAAIANAMVFHGRKITEHSDEHLADAFRSLADKDWVLGEIKELFQKPTYGT